jgi:hypothetical protein
VILLLACAAPADPGTPSVTGSGWYASPTPSPGATVHVWADVDPFTEVVTGWNGLTLTEWNGDVTWPDTPVSPIAEAVALTPETITLEGRTTTRWGPAEPVGTVLFFHGAAYDETMLTWLPAGQTLVRQAVRRGWQVVAPASAAAEASGAGGWSTASDLEAARAMVAGLQAPVVIMGMSSGGMFAHEVAAATSPAAVVGFCAPGLASTLATTTVPTAWQLAGADTTFPDGETTAKKAIAGFEARGIPYDLYVHPQTALYDARFERAGLSAADSAALAATIRDGGYYTDGWTTSGGAVDVDASPAALAEIEIMAADHELYDDGLARLWGWIDDVLARR